MVLVVGAEFCGKSEFVKERFGIEEIIDGKDCSKEDILNAKAVCNFNLFIKRVLRNEGIFNSAYEDYFDKLLKEILAKNKDCIIITNEIGLGLVPIDSFDRLYREMTGRICTRLAKEAEEVYRVFYGIGTKIKHTNGS